MNILENMGKKLLFKIIGIVVWVIFFIPTAILLLMGLMGEINIWIPLAIGIVGGVIGIGFQIASLVVSIMEMRE